MKIVGIGVDLLSLRRFKGVIDRRGWVPVARRILSSQEQSEIELFPDKQQYLQSRFAVKEALFKAASSHCRLKWSEVTMGKDETGRPVIRFHSHPELDAQVSISHDDGFLIANALVTMKRQ